MSQTTILIILIVILVFIIIGIYNKLVSLRSNRNNAFADIDVQLKQRHDLIPQLVKTVKGYMKHEDKVLTEITEARSQAINANSIDEKISAEARLGAAMNGFKIAVEAYPDLKANQNFIQLQEEISDIENKLAASRRFFNSSTKELNIAVQKFPNNIFAGMFGFKVEKMFELTPQSRVELDKTPKIEF